MTRSGRVAPLIEARTRAQIKRTGGPRLDSRENRHVVHVANPTPAHANKSRPLGCGIERPSSWAVSNHSAITTSTLASASWRVAPSAAQPAYAHRANPRFPAFEWSTARAEEHGLATNQPSGFAEAKEPKREAKTMPGLGTEFRDDAGSNPSAAAAAISP